MCAHTKERRGEVGRRRSSSIDIAWVGNMGTCDLRDGSCHASTRTANWAHSYTVQGRYSSLLIEMAMVEPSVHRRSLLPRVQRPLATRQQSLERLVLPDISRHPNVVRVSVVGDMSLGSWRTVVEEPRERLVSVWESWNVGRDRLRVDEEAVLHRTGLGGCGTAERRGSMEEVVHDLGELKEVSCSVRRCVALGSYPLDGRNWERCVRREFEGREAGFDDSRGGVPFEEVGWILDVGAASRLDGCRLVNDNEARESIVLQSRGQ